MGLPPRSAGAPANCGDLGGRLVSYETWRPRCPARSHQGRSDRSIPSRLDCHGGKSFYFSVDHAGSRPLSSHLLPTYARADVAFERGEGAWLVSTKGERFLDFGSGVAVTVLGHAHPHLVETLAEQGGQLWHVSNLFQIPQAERLAARLTEASFGDLVFFTNSGTEACEGAIKMARKYHYASGHSEKTRIITLQGAFHGRSLA